MHNGFYLSGTFFGIYGKRSGVSQKHQTFGLVIFLLFMSYLCLRAFFAS